MLKVHYKNCSKQYKGAKEIKSLATWTNCITKKFIKQFFEEILRKHFHLNRDYKSFGKDWCAGTKIKKDFTLPRWTVLLDFQIKLPNQTGFSNSELSSSLKISKPITVVNLLWKKSQNIWGKMGKTNLILLDWIILFCCVTSRSLRNS